MKHLILMRHGKSSWEYQVSDQDRPLKERGIRDAYLVASKFATLGVTIDAAYSSPANRALHTAMIFVRTTAFALANFRVEEALYDFSGESVQRFVKQIDNTHNTVALFGHNHAFTHLANTWGDQYIENLPTAGLVHLAFEVQDWAKITKGTTTHCIVPKHLRP